MKQLATCAFAIVAIGGCSNSVGTSSAPGTPIYPKGVATDAASLHETRGIYTGDSLCCWIAREAQFRVSTAPDAKSIMLNFVVPTQGPLANARQVVSLIAGDSRVSKKLHGGHDNMSLPIRSGMVVDGMLTVHLLMSNSFIPKDIGLNGDLRRLSVVLESVEAI